MTNKSGTAPQVLSLPTGGGATRGLGETFAPDLFTGTGNLKVPIALPGGRNGFQPELALAYSTGQGNGPFGLGWSLGVSSISRRTARGLPAYDDATDVFILSGADELVPVGSSPGVTSYRPRTEGLFARITHHRDASTNHWEVAERDGRRNIYGVAQAPGAAVLAAPSGDRIFRWHLTSTIDPFGNRIDYVYETANSRDDTQTYLTEIKYADFGDPAAPNFLVTVRLAYANRPDSFADHRPAFPVVTTRRCSRIDIATHASTERLMRRYRLLYAGDPEVAIEVPANGASLLARVVVEGHDGTNVEALPPLDFHYTAFRPSERTYLSLSGVGAAMPDHALGHASHELVDLFSRGLPDVVAIDGGIRYWRNLGNGLFDLPRTMERAPAAVRLEDAGVFLADANGNGRADLLVTAGSRRGYYPLAADGTWSASGFVGYGQAPAISLEAPDVRLVDLDGDGVVDALRTGDQFELYYQDPARGWHRTERVMRRDLDSFPDISFQDPRVHLADMTGDGLQDIVLIGNGRIDYWPYQGHGRWGGRVTMNGSPVLEEAGRYGSLGYDPKRLLLGDLDGDGCADLVYVGPSSTTVWVNRSGREWSRPHVVPGTPRMTDHDTVRLADVLGNGSAGILWTYDRGAGQDSRYKFLDLSGGVKAYLLDRVTNNRGATTEIDYRSSIVDFVRDDTTPATRWATTLPFPVQVVGRMVTTDHITGGRLSVEYRYRHGHWDPVDREFRGFGLVEQFDTETFETYQRETATAGEATRFSPPTLTKTWFHPGPIQIEDGGYREADWRREFWAGDGSMEPAFSRRRFWLQTLTGPQAQRHALRSLRGRIMRIEQYGLDGSDRAGRPYTVTESAYEIRNHSAGVFFPHVVAERTTHWERGDDPMTSVVFNADYDEFGQPRAITTVACPRGWRAADDRPGRAYLATRTRIGYARPESAETHIVDRVSRRTRLEIQNDGSQTITELRDWPDSHLALSVIEQELHFYDGPPFIGLPFGRLGRFGAMARTESLVLTADRIREVYQGQAAIGLPPYLDAAGSVAWTADYPQDFRDRLPSLAGYTHYAGDLDSPFAAGYFAATERRSYDFHANPGGKGRGLMLARRDALGRDTTVTYEAPFFLLPETVTDPAGLKTSAEYDYRVCQVRQLTEPNGNSTRCTFTPYGLLAEKYVRGKAGEGDQQRPGTRLEYDWLAFARTRQPMSVRTIRQVHHDSELDVPLPQRDRTIAIAEYSDGFGRLVQTRAQREALLFGDEVFGGRVEAPMPRSGPATAVVIQGRRTSGPGGPNVVVSGWQTHDNKGRVVERYEPFFSRGWDYAPPGDAETGQRAALHYDPRGRVLRTVAPDGSEQRIVPGVPLDLADPDRYRPTPWEVYIYDATDNAGRTHGAADRSRHQWNTPRSASVDALGRTISIVERNRNPGAGVGPLGPITELQTTSLYDIDGRLLRCHDPLGRAAFQCVYDLAGRKVRSESLDRGTSHIVHDAAGNAIEHRDSRGSLRLVSVDRLNRTVRDWRRDHSLDAVTLRERVIYGDGQDTGLVAAAARDANLLGRTFRHYDEAGRMTAAAYDFKGNLLEKNRAVLGSLARLAARAPDGTLQTTAFRIDWSVHDDLILDPAVYSTTVDYDALSRPKSIRNPSDAAGPRRLLVPTYDAGGALQRVEVDGTVFVEHIAYDAKGQRTLIAYGRTAGDGWLTCYAYDRQTFRLVGLRTESYRVPALASDSFELIDRDHPLQDLAYSYDLAGNVLAITDRTPGCGVLNFVAPHLASPAAAAAGDLFERQFAYDAMSRLISATGRECRSVPSPRPWADPPPCGFGSGLHRTHTQDNAPHLTDRYRETYTYDPAGNLVELSHQGPAAEWHRYYGVGGRTPQQWAGEWPARLNAPAGWPGAPGNRLTHVGDDDMTPAASHRYDESGNLVRESTSRHFEWDQANRLRSFRTQASGAEPSLWVQYFYDTAGRRVMKVTRRQGGDLETTVYIDGIFEHHRWDDAGVAKQSAHVHIMDNERRIAIWRTGDQHYTDAGPAIQYVLGDHLGGSAVVVDAAGTWTNREEYYPFGETSFGGFARKRFRFTGCERDDESGLSYHGARYYAPWLARWTACDPAGPTDGLMLYGYARNNPIRFRDPSGRIGEGPPQSADNLLPKPGTEGSVASYKDQPDKVQINGKTAIKEHPIPGAQLEALTKNDLTGQADYRNHGPEYRNDATYLNDADKAKAKTHEHGAVPSDNARTAEVKGLQADARAGKGPGANLNKDLVLPSVEHAIETGTDPAVAHRAAGEQTGNLFSQQRLADSGAKAAEYDKLAKARSLLADNAKPVAAFVLDKGAKAIPVAGALYTFHSTEGSFSWKLLNTVAGEIGVGPIDLQTAGEGLGYGMHVIVESVSSSEPPAESQAPPGNPNET